MIENGALCYLFKEQRFTGLRMYHRAVPTNETGPERWNTPIKEEAGRLTKIQWKERSEKWSYDQGWILESTTGEKEML